MLETDILILTNLVSLALFVAMLFYNRSLTTKLTMIVAAYKANVEMMTIKLTELNPSLMNEPFGQDNEMTKMDKSQPAPPDMYR